MILVDTSAWVEYLRGTGSQVNLRLRELISESASLATTDAVIMELLAGAKDDIEYAKLRRLLYRFDLLNVGGLTTYERAAELYRRCRKRGETVRSLTDCLIAAVAIRTGAEVLHNDRDFNVIARHSTLQVV